MVWINTILDPLKIAPWKTLSIDQYNKYGADKMDVRPICTLKSRITF